MGHLHCKILEKVCIFSKNMYICGRPDPQERRGPCHCAAPIPSEHLVKSLVHCQTSLSLFCCFIISLQWTFGGCVELVPWHLLVSSILLRNIFGAQKYKWLSSMSTVTGAKTVTVGWYLIDGDVLRFDAFVLKCILRKPAGGWGLDTLMVLPQLRSFLWSPLTTTHSLPKKCQFTISLSEAPTENCIENIVWAFCKTPRYTLNVFNHLYVDNLAKQDFFGKIIIDQKFTTKSFWGTKVDENYERTNQ